MGIFAILEEECMFPKASDQTFLTKLHNNHDGKHPNYAKPKGAKASYDFELGHYAGNVGYSIANWLDKNKDPINEAVASLLGKSSDPFVADMFKEYGGESKFCTMVVR
jgi:myosin heavy subunit